MRRKDQHEPIEETCRTLNQRSWCREVILYKFLQCRQCSADGNLGYCKHTLAHELWAEPMKLKLSSSNKAVVQSSMGSPRPGALMGSWMLIVAISIRHVRNTSRLSSISATPIFTVFVLSSPVLVCVLLQQQVLLCQTPADILLDTTTCIAPLVSCCQPWSEACIVGCLRKRVKQECLALLSCGSIPSSHQVSRTTFLCANRARPYADSSFHSLGVWHSLYTDPAACE